MGSMGGMGNTGGMGTGEMGGGFGGGLVGGGTDAGPSSGLARNRSGGTSNGAVGGQNGNDIRNNFGVVPAFGAPSIEAAIAGEKQNKDALTYGVLDGRIEEAISPNAWQSAGGTSSMSEFRTHLSLVVTAGVQTDQAYMTSLSITLPARGREFFFTTPRGEAKLSANGISKTVTQRAVGVMVLLLGIVLVAARRKSNKLASNPANKG